MDLHLEPVIPYKGNNTRRKSKPWWNPELTRLWKTARKAEKDLHKAKRHGKNNILILELKNCFKLHRAMFDKTFQTEKRRYQRKWQVDIDNFNTNNPKKFWEELNKLKPRTK